MQLLRSFLIGLNVVMLGYFLHLFVLHPTFHDTKIDPDLLPYVDQYKQLLTDHCPSRSFKKHHDIILVDRKPADTWIGICRYFVTWTEIHIDRVFWYGADEEEREQLIFHEMSHCFLNKEHVSDHTNYMYDTLVPLKRNQYTPQVIRDIKEYCE